MFELFIEHLRLAKFTGLQDAVNDFPVIGDLCFAHRVLGSPGGKHCKSLQRNVWREVLSSLKAVSFGHRMPHFAVLF